MTTASTDHDPLDRCFANQAWLVLSTIDAVLELEEALVAIRIHVIGNARTAKLDGMLQNSFQRGMQPAKVVASQ